MCKFYSGSLLLVLGAAALAGNAGSADAPNTPTKPVNLVVSAKSNGGAGTAGLPDGWNSWMKPEKAFQVHSTDEGRGTDSAIRIEGSGEYAGVTTNPVPIDPSFQDAYRARVKTEPKAPNTSVILKLDFFDENHQYLKSSEDQPFHQLPPGEWTAISRVESMQAYSTARFVAVGFGLGNPGGAAVFEDVEMEARSADPANLAPDASMESVVGANPVHWHLNHNPEATVELLRRSAPVRDGWYSMELKGASVIWAVADGGMVPVEKGKKYVLTGYARARTGSAKIRIGYTGPKGYLGSTEAPATRENEWKQFTVTADFNKFPDTDHIYASGIAEGGDVDVFFDDFVLKAE